MHGENCPLEGWRGDAVTRLTSLNRQRLRDLWQMKAQALAIAMVVASGVAMFVMYLSSVSSLRATQQSCATDHVKHATVHLHAERGPLRLDELVRRADATGTPAHGHRLSPQ